MSNPTDKEINEVIKSMFSVSNEDDFIEWADEESAERQDWFSTRRNPNTINTVMPKYLDDQLDAIDASVFSGDAFFDAENRKEFRRRMERWEKVAEVLRQDGC